jgi:tRNA threonylcarbamoyladenosine biosynthesis protein TsaE
MNAKDWLKKIFEGREGADSAFVAGLSGHLGAGKTAFTKAVAAELGIPEVVTSPTFVLMKIYDISGSRETPFRRLVHIDAYRLEKPEELEALKWEQLVADPHNLIMVEWPENVGLGKEGLDEWLKFEIRDVAYTIHAK